MVFDLLGRVWLASGYVVQIIVKVCEGARLGYPFCGSRAALVFRSCVSADFVGDRLGARVAYVRF